MLDATTNNFSVAHLIGLSSTEKLVYIGCTWHEEQEYRRKCDWQYAIIYPLIAV